MIKRTPKPDRFPAAACQVRAARLAMAQFNDAGGRMSA